MLSHGPAAPEPGDGAGAAAGRARGRSGRLLQRVRAEAQEITRARGRDRRSPPRVGGCEVRASRPAPRKAARGRRRVVASSPPRSLRPFATAGAAVSGPEPVPPAARPSLLSPARTRSPASPPGAAPLRSAPAARCRRAGGPGEARAGGAGRGGGGSGGRREAVRGRSGAGAGDVPARGRPPPV